MSELSGVPVGTLNKILSGQTKDPKLETLKAIAKVLGCKLDDFDDPHIENISDMKFTDEEYFLIEKYRRLNREGKDKILDQIDDMLELGRYTKDTELSNASAI